MAGETNEKEKPAEGRVHEQKNPDGSTSNYDDTGDEVKKNNQGGWVKNSGSAGASGSTTSTTSVDSTGSTTTTTK